MKKSVNRIQRVVAILCCVLIVLGVQVCSDDDNLEKFEQVQILQGKWLINGIIGHPKEKFDIFILTKVSGDEKYVWGTTILIKDENFVCSYSAPCGNDCFPSSEGQIGKINEQQVKILVKQFDQIGDCEEEHLKLNKNLGVYNVEKISEKEIKLVKVE